MKRLGFLTGVGVALGLSLFGALGFVAIGTVADPGTAVRLIITAVTTAYLLIILRASTLTTGRVTTIVAWLLTAAGLWLWWPSLLGFCIAHVLAIWLLRSLYLHDSFLGICGDLVIGALALAAATVAIAHTTSLFLALWCFFLVQATFVWLPGSRKSSTPRPALDPFNHAYRAAQTALHRIASTTD